MIWFDPDNDSGFNLGTPDWSGDTAKLADNDNVCSIVIGQPYTSPQPTPLITTPPPASDEPEPEQPPPPPPEPQVDARIENNLKLLSASMSELAKKKKEFEQRDLSFCIELAFGIAKELVCGAIDTHPEKVLDIVRESLGMFEEEDHPVVRIHPELIEALTENSLLDEISGIENLTIKEDPAVSKMGCLVTANRKSVDGQVLERLQKIRTLFEVEQGEKG